MNTLCIVCGDSMEDGHGHIMSARFLTEKARALMAKEKASSNPERKENTKLEKYKTAVNDARYIFNTYKDNYPAEAWETLRKILFNKDLK